MIGFIAWRLLQAIPLLIGVSLIGFGLMHLAPGGPLAVYTLNPTIQAQDIERIKIIFGLDQPVHIQYVKWASGIFSGNWGYTFFGGRPGDFFGPRIGALGYSESMGELVLSLGTMT